MLAAFEDLGCKVDLVTGYSAERKRCIAGIKQNVRNGAKYDFVYSESSTMPTILTDPHHLPLHPLLDWLFFRFCKSKKIPVGLFYRDIYWRFEGYGVGLDPIKTMVAKAAYRLDLWVYQDTLTKLYLPSLEMGSYVPKVSPDIFDALPPGHSSPAIPIAKPPHFDRKPLKLFYVGGMSNNYQLHKLFNVLREMPQVELTVCTRKAEWRAVRDGYSSLTPNINIIHETGEKMETQLQKADIALLFVKPQQYREFASPVKLYEYLGFCKPVLATEGTLAGRFVRENQIGWTIPYAEDAVKHWLSSLLTDPSQIFQIHKNMAMLAILHSWKARAQQVVKDLTQ